MQIQGSNKYLPLEGTSHNKSAIQYYHRFLFIDSKHWVRRHNRLNKQIFKKEPPFIIKRIVQLAYLG
jgi:hypothetical protein